MSDQPPKPEPKPQARAPDEIDGEPVELSGPDPHPWGTIGLVLANLAVGLVMAWSGVPVLASDPAALITFGAVDPIRVWSGEAWRLFTACFVHVGAWHLGLNLWVLWQIGRIFERLVGPARVVLVYVVSGLFGFALSIALSPGLTAGASGAVFGVTGALLAVATVARHRLLGRFLATTLLPFVAATFALGVLVPMINNWAHFGGLMMGFLLGYAVSAGDPKIGTIGDESAANGVDVSSARSAKATVALIVSLATFAGVGAYALQPTLSPRFHAVMGLRDLHTAQLTPPGAVFVERAAVHAAAAAGLAENDAGTLLLQSRLAEVGGDDASARTLASRAFARRLQGSRMNTFEKLLVEFALLEPGAAGDDVPYSDGFAVRALCRAAIDDAPDSDEKTPAPQLKNSCAWLYARADETAVRNPVRAVELAREAHAEAPADATISHTLAVSLAASGNAKDGLALLEKLEIDGAGSLSGAFLRAERQRLEALVVAQTKATAPPSPPSP